MISNRKKLNKSIASNDRSLVTTEMVCDGNVSYELHKIPNEYVN